MNSENTKSEFHLRVPVTEGHIVNQGDFEATTEEPTVQGLPIGHIAVRGANVFDSLQEISKDSKSSLD